VVADKWARRRKLAALVESTFVIQDQSREISESLDTADSLVIGACTDLAQSRVEPMPVLVDRALESIERSFEHRNQGLLAGINTRFGYLDKQTGGIRDCEYWLIGGRPGMGKTSWLCSLVINLAVEQNIAIGLISLEMSRDELVLRMLCALSGADSMHLRTGYLSRVDRDKLKSAAVRLARAPIFIDYAPSITPAQVRSKARRLVQGYGAKIIGVDHLHEIHVPEARGDERIQATEAGTALHWIAKFLKVPVIGLAQLSRSFESESAKSRSRRPRMTDLRGSGNLEQKADFIGILWRNREEEEEDQAGDEKSIPVSLEIVKQRNGPLGECRMTFIRNTFKYADRYENTGSEAGLAHRHEQRNMEDDEFELRESQPD
jgi:replicative DNA helicase